MIKRPQKTAKQTIGPTGHMAVPKKATAVVVDVKSMAYAASGNAKAATCSVVPWGSSCRAFFHLSTATNTSSAPFEMSRSQGRAKKCE